MSRHARGRLEGDRVRVDDVAEANRLHNKGHVGRPLSGNALELSLVEAVHAVESGRLVVHDGDRRLGVPELLELGAAAGAEVEVQALCYHDLRERGLVVRHAADADRFDVWPRGAGPRDEPWFTDRPQAERAGVRASGLLGAAGQVLSVVDEDGAVTHYRVDEAAAAGGVPEGDLPRAAGVPLQDRVVVADAAAAAAYHTREHLGTPHGELLVLSFTEAQRLRDRGVLDVPDLTERAAARQHHFARTLPVYTALRQSGVVARSGFKFGTHLRGYRQDPGQGHAQWLVHCAAPDEVLHWSELSRAVRLAHGVRKSFLVAVPHGGRIRFLELSWFRP